MAFNSALLMLLKTYLIQFWSKIYKSNCNGCIILIFLKDLQKNDSISIEEIPSQYQFLSLSFTLECLKTQNQIILEDVKQKNFIFLFYSGPLAPYHLVAFTKAAFAFLGPHQ